MARELPPNLDDGELWLPSEIIPEVASPRPIKCGAASAYDLDALAMELAALGFFDPCRIPNKPAPAAVPPLPALAKVGPFSFCRNVQFFKKKISPRFSYLSFLVGFLSGESFRIRVRAVPGSGGNRFVSARCEASSASGLILFFYLII